MLHVLGIIVLVGGVFFLLAYAGIGKDQGGEPMDFFLGLVLAIAGGVMLLAKQEETKSIPQGGVSHIIKEEKKVVTDKGGHREITREEKEVIVDEKK
ncbi:MAG: hypothetical protein Q8P05_04130 [Candidatus Diapherotrites archaeon]|nr:hypothetical protein [Candidatus Diapherotrites archaeon]MDZ4256920.1 hypothetical protein [archaeon]